jgi:hypothetical protein
MADMATYIQLAQDLPAWQALLVEGDHGIGKSDGARQLADACELPLIDMRLSLMEAGDLIGLPEFVTRPFADPKKEQEYIDDLTGALRDVDGREAANAISAAIATKWGKKGETRFAPPSWLIDVGERPHILFLDEMNRAKPEVEQASFQLILDRNINGHHLHPGTRVIAAINTGYNYKVEPMDPALKDRFAVVRLEPSKKAWIKWASTAPKGGSAPVHHSVVSFIKDNEGMLELEPGVDPDPNKVNPSRRSWARTSAILVERGLLTEGVPSNINQARILNIVSAMCGPECANGFITHLRTALRQVKASELLKRFEDIRERIDADNPDYLHALNDRLERYIKANKLTTEMAKNYYEYVCLLPDEMKVSFHSRILECGNHANIAKVTATKVTQLLVQALKKTGTLSNRSAA